jgi:hypothetical protein
MAMTAVRTVARSTVAAARRLLRHRWAAGAWIGATVAVVALVGVIIGVLLFAHTTINVGPFSAEMSVRPSLRGGTEVDIPPLGSLHLDSHDGPIHLRVDLGALDQRRTE